MHRLLKHWAKQLQTLQMLWLDQKRIFAMVYHRLKSSLCLFSYFSRLKLINDGDYTAATQDAEMLAVLLGNEVCEPLPC